MISEPVQDYIKNANQIIEWARWRALNPLALPQGWIRHWLFLLEMWMLRTAVESYLRRTEALVSVCAHEYVGREAVEKAVGRMAVKTRLIEIRICQALSDQASGIRPLYWDRASIFAAAGFAACVTGLSLYLEFR
jgi:hypothetical protein